MSYPPAAGGATPAVRPRLDARGLRIGSLVGVPIIVARSWLVIAAVVTLLFAGPVATLTDVSRPVAYLVALGYALLLFVSVLVHEVAHAWSARLVGMPASHVVINLWGGHTQFEGESTSPGRSFFVAVVGPVSNGLLAAAAWGLAAVTALDGVPGLLLSALAVTNALVAGFNLVPGLPLDGGRLLEAAVWRVTGRRATGTLVAGWAGRAFAVALGVWVLVLPLLQGRRPELLSVVWVGLIGVFLWQGATASIQVARVRLRTPSLSVAALALPAVAVPGSASVQEVLALASAAGVREVVLLDRVGRPAALLDPAAADSVPADRADVVPAHSAARVLPEGAVVPAATTGDDVLQVLRRVPASQYAVTDPAGRVVGVLHTADVVAAVTSRR